MQLWLPEGLPTTQYTENTYWLQGSLGTVKSLLGAFWNYWRYSPQETASIKWRTIWNYNSQGNTVQEKGGKGRTSQGLQQSHI